MSTHRDTPVPDLVGHPEPTSEELLAAVHGWNEAADREEAAIALGIALAPWINRDNADLYRRVAKSIQIEIATGHAVCVCCLKPYSRGAHV